LFLQEHSDTVVHLLCVSKRFTSWFYFKHIITCLERVHFVDFFVNPSLGECFEAAIETWLCSAFKLQPSILQVGLAILRASDSDIYKVRVFVGKKAQKKLDAITFHIMKRTMMYIESNRSWFKRYRGPRPGSPNFRILQLCNCLMITKLSKRNSTTLIVPSWEKEKLLQWK